MLQMRAIISRVARTLIARPGSTRTPAIITHRRHFSLTASTLNASSAAASIHHTRSFSSNASLSSSTPSPSATRPPPPTPESAAPAAPDSSRLASNSRLASIAFARWLAGAGVRFNSTQDNRPLFVLKRLPSNPNDWYLSSASTRTIQKGETIFRLPIALTLAPSSACPDPMAAHILQHLMKDIPEELWTLKNGLRLLYEYSLMTSPPVNVTSADSFYAPYINLLPNAYPTVPIFWNATEATALQYQPLQTQMKLRANFIRTLSPKLTGLKDLFGKDLAAVTTPERIGWSMSSVSSRAFQIRSSECSNLPLIDMMNHSFTNNCKVKFDPADPKQEIQVEAIMDIPPNTELTLNYGWHNNDGFLLNYGFILDENPADNLQFARNPEALEIAADMAGEKVQPLTGWKTEIAQQLGFASSASTQVTSPTPLNLTQFSVDQQLLAYIQLLLTPDSLPITDRTIDYFMKHTGTTLPSSTNTFSTASGVSTAASFQPQIQDLSALSKSPNIRILFSYLSLLQSTFPTTLQQDVDELSKLVSDMLTSEPDPVRAQSVQRTELAIRFRIGKKRILAEQMKRIQLLM